MSIKKQAGRLVLLLVCVLATVVQAAPSEQPAARLGWWRAARFGMFIHWGPVALTGQEISWSRANSNTNCPNNGTTPVGVYDNLYKNFNPTNFNAAEWVEIAEATGMKYMVLTAKHGDGFLLWPSRADGYNIGATPFRRDVCAELAAAAHHQSMRLGWYFSPMDWRDPDCRSANNARFNLKNQSELRELLSNYGQIDVLWFDCDGRPADWDPVHTYALVRKLQPQIIINNRLEMSTSEEWLNQGGLKPNEDFYTPEQRIGAYDDQAPWETCMTLGTQWSWKPDDKIKGAAEVISILARTVGGDGNLLLDVGPMPDGRIEPRQVEVLKQVGVWMDRNGASIYGTRGGPWKPTKNVASTRNGNIIYLHVLPETTKVIELPDITRHIKSASLASGSQVNIVQRDGKLVIMLPATERDPLDMVVKLELDGSAMDLPALEVTPKIKATASNVFQNQVSQYGPQFAFDDDANTRWATDNGTGPVWIAADLGRVESIRGVRIHEAYPNRVQNYELQFLDGTAWKTFLTGATLGADCELAFPVVKAREFRLNILSATQGPTINEIEFLEP